MCELGDEMICMSSSDDETMDDLGDGGNVPSGVITEDKELFYSQLTRVKCLFCIKTFASIEQTLEHCSDDHSFCIKKFTQKFSLDCYSYIKLINYIRSLPQCSKYHVTDVSNILPHPWQDDIYLKPVISDDPLLLFDIESLVEDVQHHSDEQTYVAKNCLTCSPHLQHLMKRLEQAEMRAAEAEETLESATNDINTMRKTAKLFMFESKQMTQHNKSVTLSVDEDQAYFDSYSHYSIHNEMLNDKIRTESYKDFILGNPTLFKDKVVLDVGCGTGILSLFAATAGASHVIAVDQSDVIYKAMDIARENNLHHKITFIRGCIEDVTLPVDKVDVIVSEWMGYFLLFECMLDSVLYARDKYLHHSGMVLPGYCSILLSAVSDLDQYDRMISFWDNVYGYKMSCMKSCVLSEGSVETVNPDSVVSDPCIIKDINIATVTSSQLDYESDFIFEITRDSIVTGICGYFDINFNKQEHCNQVYFSTCPSSVQTHWKQTLFLLPKVITVEKGERLSGKLTCQKNAKDPRSLIVYIHICGAVVKYHLQ